MSGDEGGWGSGTGISPWLWKPEQRGGNCLDHKQLNPIFQPPQKPIWHLGRVTEGDLCPDPILREN